MSDIMKGTSFEVTGLHDFDIEFVDPIEDGNTPLENATKKAWSYYKQLGCPVYSTDTALYFEGVSKDDQPGAFVKRIHGENLEGREFQKYYMAMAKKYGGKIKAYYKNAICLIIDENTIYQYDGKDIWSEEFYIVDSAHSDFEEGFPLDSLSVHIESGKYYNDLEDYESEDSVDNGFRKFFSSIKI